MITGRLVFLMITNPVLFVITDHQGRYSFDNQPAVALWSLQRLAQTLSPFVAVDALNEALDSYQQVLLTHYGQRMRQKLGFMTEQKRITRY